MYYQHHLGNKWSQIAKQLRGRYVILPLTLTILSSERSDMLFSTLISAPGTRFATASITSPSAIKRSRTGTDTLYISAFQDYRVGLYVLPTEWHVMVVTPPSPLCFRLMRFGGHGYHAFSAVPYYNNPMAGVMDSPEQKREWSDVEDGNLRPSGHMDPDFGGYHASRTNSAR